MALERVNSMAVFTVSAGSGSSGAPALYTWFISA